MDNHESKTLTEIKEILSEMNERQKPKLYRVRGKEVGYIKYLFSNLILNIK